jgi:hypothetical protein
MQKFISLLLACFFLFLGLIILLLPWSTSMQEGFRYFMTIHVWTWSLLGAGFFLIGVSLLTYAFYSLQKTSYTLNIGKHSIEVSEKVLTGYLNNYWQHIFPEKHVASRLVLKQKGIKVSADLPYIELSEQKKLLQKIDNDLAQIFRDLLGYTPAITLRIEFERRK